MSVADINYLKKNISKCRWQISRSFRRTPRHWQNICETLQVRAISGSGYVYLEKLKRPPLPSGVRIPDVNIRVEVATAGYKLAVAECKLAVARCKLAATGCKLAATGCKWRRASVCKWRQPGIIPTRICCPDALRWCIRTPCPGILLA